MTTRHKHYKWSQLTQDDIIWCDKTQELTIDLSLHVEEPTHLILTSWQQGISWKTLINAEQAQPHLNPFEVPPFPFRFLEIDLLRDWQALIPDKILQKISRFKINTFGMLNLCSRYQYANELFASNPVLFWLLFVHIQKSSRDEAEFMNLCQRKQTDILKAIDIFAKKPALKLLKKIKSRHYSQKEYYLICILLNDEFEKLNHRERVSIAQVQLVIAAPQFIKSPLLNQWQDIECVHHKMRLVQTITDTGYLIENLNGNKQEMQQQLYHCANESAVQKLHDKLLEQMYQESTAEDEQSRAQERLQQLALWGVVNEESYETVEPYFPEPPLSGNQDIIPITSYQQLQKEGLQLRHCVAAYHQEVSQGSYAIYQMLSPERATLGIKIKPTREGQLKFEIDQIKGVENQDVARKTRKAAASWLQQAKAQREKDAAGSKRS